MRTLPRRDVRIKSLDIDGNGVDKAEYVVGMLIKLEMIDGQDVLPFWDEFDRVCRL